MNSYKNIGRVLVVSAALALGACSSSSNTTGTGGHVATGTGGVTGTGGLAAAGTGGSDDGGALGTGGMTGTGGGTGTGGVDLHGDHLRIINKATTGGINVSRTPPIAYDQCKI